MPARVLKYLLLIWFLVSRGVFISYLYQRYFLFEFDNYAHRSYLFLSWPNLCIVHKIILLFILVTGQNHYTTPQRCNVYQVIATIFSWLSGTWSYCRGSVMVDNRVPYSYLIRSLLLHNQVPFCYITRFHFVTHLSSFVWSLDMYSTVVVKQRDSSIVLQFFSLQKLNLEIF